MGVKNLWKLLSAASTKVELSQLTGCIIAVDASILIINSFSKEKSVLERNKTRNQYLYTLLKRIVVLLEHGILPIFVFDGKTPYLKEKEVLRRIKERNSITKQAKILARSIFNKILDKRIKVEEEVVEEKEDVFKGKATPLSEDDYMTLLKELAILENEGDKEKGSLEKNIINSFIDIVSDKQILRENEIEDIRKVNSINELLKTINVIFESKIEPVIIEGNSKEEENNYKNHLNQLIHKFEVKHTLKQVKNNLKEELNDEKIKEVIKEKGLDIDINDYKQKKIHDVASDNNRQIIMLSKGEKDSFMERLKMHKPSHKDKPKRRARRGKRRYDINDILSRFNNIRKETHTYTQPMNTFTAPIVKEEVKEDKAKEKINYGELVDTNNFDSLFQNNLVSDDEADHSHIHIYNNNIHKNDLVTIQPNKKESNKKSRRESSVSLSRGLKFDFSDESADEYEKIKTNTIDKKEKKDIEQKDIRDDQMDYLNRKRTKYEKLKEEIYPEPLLAPGNESNLITMDDICFNRQEIKASTTDMVKLLLDQLGLKYIIASEEAEAQCAYLQMKGLVHYIITEDSDTFLFGGTKVIRNFSAFCKGEGSMELYTSKNLNSVLGLNRSKCILLGLLLGCDYCEGVRGIGIVNAMETITHFHNIDDFSDYLKLWGELPDSVNSNTKAIKAKLTAEQAEFLEYHKNYKKHWIFPDDFPNRKVVEAFQTPKVNENFTVDISKLEPFNEDGFRAFLYDSFDLSKGEFDWLINKIKNGHKAYNKVKITNFFHIENGDKQYAIKSKRLQKTIGHIREKVKAGNKQKKRVK